MSLVEGIELFVYHCKEHLPTWDWTPEYRRMVVQVVEQLDRIPLAIELVEVDGWQRCLLAALYQSVADRFVALKSQSIDPNAQDLVCCD